MPDTGTLAVSLGRAFAESTFETEEVIVDTPYGKATLHKMFEQWVVFRHDRAHDRLPHRIAYRAQMAALKSVGVRSLISTGIVGILNDELPLHEPMLVSDVVMPTGVLPDGSPCTMFTRDGGGYLVLEEGLISRGLCKQLRGIGTVLGDPLTASECVVHHVAGPRSRTRAESELLVRLGVQAVSMTLVPEIVLANEMGISTAAIVTGYRTLSETLSSDEVERRLAASRPQLEAVCAAFLKNGRPIAFQNSLQRFGADT